ncbi:MAG: biotin--[acetyl-CoA-carboxylase] ligase [Candidatus Caenarcaniphilales bacterium]|jgi:BirA family biotin operon repressor/biotin-[acetyl-CoA-carboxylase] ligase|nr:biotin--[acetyl-CoA-carboxylase] ligase [Candidatus Caenarcaniphilales bacterium]
MSIENRPLSNMNTYVFDNLDSTQNKARELIDANTPLPFLVIASQQTSGRGTKARSWLSPVGGLYMTAVFEHLAGDDIAQDSMDITKKVAISLKSSLEQYTEGLFIKPINDIYHADKKLAGILVEIVQSKYLLVGIGVNIDKPDLDTAISLKELCETDIEPKALAVDIASILKKDLA